MSLIEREWMRLRAAEMIAAVPGLSLSDAEEEAVAEWDRGMADRDAELARERTDRTHEQLLGAVEALTAARSKLVDQREPDAEAAVMMIDRYLNAQR